MRVGGSSKAGGAVLELNEEARPHVTDHRTAIVADQNLQRGHKWKPMHYLGTSSQDTP